jgi:hypothetical protein
MVNAKQSVHTAQREKIPRFPRKKDQTPMKMLLQKIARVCTHRTRNVVWLSLLAVVVLWRHVGRKLKLLDPAAARRRLARRSREHVGLAREGVLGLTGRSRGNTGGTAMEPQREVAVAKRLVDRRGRRLAVHDVARRRLEHGKFI